MHGNGSIRFAYGGPESLFSADHAYRLTARDLMHIKITGLTADEVHERKRLGRTNATARHRTKTTGEILVENAFSVFNIIIGCIVAFLAFFHLQTGDGRLLLDAAGVLMVAVLNTCIAMYQEIRAKRALDKVNLLLKKEVTVVRDGEEISIPHESIVMDDVVVLQRGDQAVVDAVLVEGRRLEMNESLLTGESEPVVKQDGDEILSGSFCLSGTGYCRVTRVGRDCHAAQITQSAKKYKFIVTPLQKKIDAIVKGLFVMAVLLVLLTLFVRGADGFGINVIRRIATIMVALVPQGLVLMSSVTFAIGVYRISRIGAVVQKLNAVESFANVRVICLDKTGTLTKNELAVHEVTLLDQEWDGSRLRKALGTFAGLSTERNSTMRALEVFPAFADTRVIGEIPFSSDRKMSFLHVSGAMTGIYVLGGLDLLLAHSEPVDRARIESQCASAGLDVFRNVLLAKVTGPSSLELLEAQPDEFRVQPLGIVSITDVVRTDVRDALELFESRNVQLKILSGDAATAIQAVCREIGWNIEPAAMIDGAGLDRLDDDGFAGAVEEKKIFARLTPDHKLRIIRELRRRKLYTAMIGDGVNDLPAIKEADMGIAMEEGSAITKEVADIVLLKNRFTLLPSIFDEGNRIVNTVASVAKLFLTKNFMVVFLTLLSILFLLEFPLTPRRVSLLNIFAIGLPAFIIAIRNKDTSPNKRFMHELISFVTLSALVITGAGYFAQFMAMLLTSQSDAGDMVMLTSIVIASVGSFLAVIRHAARTDSRIYFGYAGCLVMVYYITAAIAPDVVPFTWLRMFYEIGPVNVPVSLATGITGAAVLYLLQLVRDRVVRKLYHL
jgi:cation-transporting ATPase E